MLADVLRLAIGVVHNDRGITSKKIFYSAAYLQSLKKPLIGLPWIATLRTRVAHYFAYAGFWPTDDNKNTLGRATYSGLVLSWL